MCSIVFIKDRNQKQGIGLGLSICQNIIERLGGRIGVSSEQGKRLLFLVHFTNLSPKRYLLNKRKYRIFVFEKRNEKTISTYGAVFNYKNKG